MVINDIGVAAGKESRLWYRQPASKWLEALPLGNGRLGAMLWGGPQRDRVDLNIDTLWSGGPRTAHTEDAAAVLAELRAAVLERRAYAEADRLALRLQGSFNEAYQPLGQLTVDFGDVGEVQNYERSLDMRDGVATVRYEVAGSLYEREAFASRPDGAFVMQLRALGTGKLNVTLDLGSPHPDERYVGDDGIGWLEGRAPRTSCRIIGTKNRPSCTSPPSACALPRAWQSGLMAAWFTPQVREPCGSRVPARSPCS